MKTAGPLLTADPRTGAVAGRFPRATAAAVSRACTAARTAFVEKWRTTTGAERASALLGIAAALRRHKLEMARLEAGDTGKSLEDAAGEVDGAIALWEYAAALARTDGSRSFINSLARGAAFTLREPIGVVGMIVPWNYPLITTSERLPFALAAGCTVILKPSELAVGALANLVRLIRRLLPADVVHILHGEGEAVGKALCEHPEVDMIAFVGSTRVGRLIEANAARHGKRVSAELGGNNFVLVYADADLDTAARAVVASGFRNAGQACIAGTHVLVAPQVAPPFVAALSQALADRFGSAETGTPIQPLISPAHKTRIQSLIDRGIAEGLMVVSGSRTSGPGNFTGPVIFDQVPPASMLFRDEIFGPIVTVTHADAADFFRIANSTGYGLAGYAWTSSTATAQAVARELRVGRLWINTAPDFWLPELPVGGFGASGTGRELGPDALDTYSLPKSVLFS